MLVLDSSSLFTVSIWSIPDYVWFIFCYIWYSCCDLRILNWIESCCKASLSEFRKISVGSRNLALKTFILDCYLYHDSGLPITKYILAFLCPAFHFLNVDSLICCNIFPVEFYASVYNFFILPSGILMAFSTWCYSWMYMILFSAISSIAIEIYESSTGN